MSPVAPVTGVTSHSERHTEREREKTTNEETTRRTNRRRDEPSKERWTIGGRKQKRGRRLAGCGWRGR